MDALPIDSHLPELIEVARRHRAMVLVAEPGAGKTTRLPPAIVRAGILGLEHPNLVLLQPRRVAARAAAARIAQENGWQVGGEVGYQVRFDRRIGPRTRLHVLTEGILTRRLGDDPILDGVGCVVLDEFHERSIHTDLAIALLREVRQTIREDLILIVMSATLDAEPVARFLGDCPVVRIEGRTHPVQISHAPPPAGAMLPEQAADAVVGAIDSDRAGGDVLVFLPGVQEIRRTMHLLEPLAARHDLLVLPLHGTLTLDEQVRALRPSPQRKIVLATNIAQTSLTVDGVTTVIDTGVARVASYDPQRGLDRLELQPISKASATQRAGRAGRTRPGRCVRLWTEKQQAALDEFELPEVERVDLAGTVLTLHAWGQGPRAFAWYQPPPDAALSSAERLLAMLGALDGEPGRITPLGRRLLSMPAHPRIARLLLAADDSGVPYEGATMAALLSEKDILLPAHAADRPAVQGTSDLLYRLHLLAQAEKSRFRGAPDGVAIDESAARQVARTRNELLRIAGRTGGGRSTSHDADERQLLRILLLAYPDRVCRRRGTDPMSGVMTGGGGVRLAGESIVRQAEYFLALDARRDDRARAQQALVRLASAIEPEWLEELFPQHIIRQRQVVFDEQRGRIVVQATVSYRDLVMRQDQDAAVEPAEAAAALAEALRPRARQIIESDEQARTWLARLDLLRSAMPQHDWPAVGDAELADLLAAHASGRRGLDEIRRLPLASILHDHLPFRLRRLMDAEAPLAIQVPSGSRITVQYALGQSPVMAVRLQELFGWSDTPRIAGGRIAVVLHLLGPNFRPVQVTSDLKSFWANTYPQVRKDLRARYPRHAWPDDPLTATPQAKGGRRR
jgi:ATP-dependent helicase HrpB